MTQIEKNRAACEIDRLFATFYRDNLSNFSRKYLIETTDGVSTYRVSYFSMLPEKVMENIWIMDEDELMYNN